jgi:hypothetical protein
MERTIMDHSVNALARGTRHWEPKFPFDLVVGYEDIATRNQALRLYDRLAQRLIDDYDFQCTWWKFEFLQSPTLFEQAADAAAEANMVVLSLRDSEAVPEIARQWLEAVTHRRDYRKSALVALICNLTPDKIRTAPVVTTLQGIAHLARMDFFCNTFDLPRESTDTSFEDISVRVHTVTPLLDEILHHRAPYPRGINE